MMDLKDVHADVDAPLTKHDGGCSISIKDQKWERKPVCSFFALVYLTFLHHEIIFKISKVWKHKKLKIFSEKS